MNRIIKIILHLFYWLVFCLLSGVISFRLSEEFDFISANILQFVYNLGWAAIQFYLFYFIFYKFIEQQKYVRYFIFSALESIVLSISLTVLFAVVFRIKEPFSFMDYVPQTVGTFVIGNTGSLLKGFIRWFDDIQHKQEMEKAMLQNELDMLNAQLNPHFLFNTLNNIDSLIVSNPEKASESLITLSEIMRYMLYEAKKKTVLLKSEVVHYQNIIKMQALRMKDPSKVKFVVDIDNEAAEVAPLIFLPFLENAFKYAVFENRNTAIDIRLKSIENKIEFSCSNYYDESNEHNNKKSGGIGLANLERRLQLLYKGKYRLDIHNENSYFSVYLSLET